MLCTIDIKNSRGHRVGNERIRQQFEEGLQSAADSCLTQT